jgi:hypothetical protein
MSKIFKIKEWLTLDDAANHISNVLGEPISLSDIYKLALDGHLKLSLMFVNGAKAKRVRLVKSEDVEYKQVVPRMPNVPNGKCFHVPHNAKMQISKDYWIQKVEPELISIGGVWDLAMIGAELADITNRYHQVTSSHTVKIPRFTGHYLQKGGETYQLQVRQERFPESGEDNASIAPNAQDENERLSLQDMRLMLKRPYRPPQYSVASKLADYEHTLVIRTSEINRFIQSLEDAPQEAKPLHDKERTTLLILLGSILKKANFDLHERGIAGKIRRATESNHTPVSEETIRNLLPHIRDIVELKQNN